MPLKEPPFVAVPNTNPILTKWAVLGKQGQVSMEFAAEEFKRVQGVSGNSYWVPQSCSFKDAARKGCLARIDTEIEMAERWDISVPNIRFVPGTVIRDLVANVRYSVGAPEIPAELSYQDGAMVIHGEVLPTEVPVAGGTTARQSDDRSYDSGQAVLSGESLVDSKSLEEPAYVRPAKRTWVVPAIVLCILSVGITHGLRHYRRA